MTKLLFDLFLNYGKIEKNCVILCVVVTTASVRLMLLIYAQDRKLIHASDLQRSFELKARSDDGLLKTHMPGLFNYACKKYSQIKRS